MYVLSGESFLEDRVRVIKQYFDSEYYIERHFKEKLIGLFMVCEGTLRRLKDLDNELGYSKK